MSKVLTALGGVLTSSPSLRNLAPGNAAKGKSTILIQPSTLALKSWHFSAILPTSDLSMFSLSPSTAHGCVDSLYIDPSTDDCVGSGGVLIWEEAGEGVEVGYIEGLGCRNERDGCSGIARRIKTFGC
jgi:hypothetical protein